MGRKRGKANKYFCYVESRIFLNKTIKKVEIHNGTTIYNQSEILDHVRLFYEELYLKNEDHITHLHLEDLLNNFFLINYN